MKLMMIAEERSKARLQEVKKTVLKSSSQAVKMRPAGWMRKRFYQIRGQAAQVLWEDGRLKNKRKEDHLEARFKLRNEQGYVDGIAVGDMELEQEEDVE